MINMVLDPQNLPVIEKAVERLEKDDFFVNLSAMQPSGIYTGRTERTERELDIIEAYNTPIDIKYKVLKPPTKGAPCFYPALTYYLQYDGLIRVFCSNDAPQNLFTDGLPSLAREAVPCPFDRCGGCNDMYRSLAEEPLQTTPLTVFTHREYVEEVKAYRQKQRKRNTLRKLPLGIGRLFESKESSRALFEQAMRTPPLPNPAFVNIATNGNGKPLPEEQVFGSTDESGRLIEAFSRDRIALSGWAATRDREAFKVRILLDSQELGTVTHFKHRPEVAASYGKPELANCGWETMLYLPALDPGEYQLSVEAFDSSGNMASLAAPRLRIVE